MTTVIFCQDKSIASAASCHKTPPIVHDLVNGSLARLCPSDTSRIRPRLQRHHLWQNVTFKPSWIWSNLTLNFVVLFGTKNNFEPLPGKKPFFFFLKNWLVCVVVDPLCDVRNVWSLARIWKNGLFLPPYPYCSGSLS